MTQEETRLAQADLDAQIAALSPEQREQFDRGAEGLVAAIKGFGDEVRRRRSVAILDHAARWYGQKS